MKQRWFRLLVGLFPPSFRKDRGAEMLDALEGSDAVLVESCSLVGAWPGSWNRHLRTPHGVRSAAALGAFLWFGLLLGVGPLLRGASAASDTARWASRAGSLTPTWMVWFGAVLLAGSLLAALRSRLLASLLFGSGIAVSALANSVGQWSFVRSLFYELRWIGLAAAAAFWLCRWRVRWFHVMATLAVAGVSSALLFGIGTIRTTYGFALSQHLPVAITDIEVYQQARLLDVLAVALTVVIAVGPWISPAVGGLFLPAVVHTALIQPAPSHAMVLYLAAVVWLQVVYLPRRAAQRHQL